MRALILATLTCLSVSAAQGAGLEGSTADFGVYYPSVSQPISTSVDAIVGPGVEFAGIGALALPGYVVANSNVDVSATQVSIDYLTSLTAAQGAFNGYILNFSGTSIPTIVGASLNPVSTFTSSQVSITFDSDSLFISLPGVSVNQNSAILVDLQLAPVPEPATYATLSAGLATILLLRRRRSHSHNS